MNLTVQMKTCLLCDSGLEFKGTYNKSPRLYWRSAIVSHITALAVMWKFKTPSTALDALQQISIAL
jgi:hypothetical protein